MNNKTNLKLLFVFFIPFLLLVASCKKGNEDSGGSVSIKGKWVFRLENTKTYKNGSIIYDVDDDGDGTSFLNITDNAAVFSVDGHADRTFSYTYDASAKRLKMVGDFNTNYDVQTLTSSKLVLVEKSDVRDGGYMDITTTTYTK